MINIRLNLLKMKIKGDTFKTIIEILEEKLGYKTYSSVLNSMTHANIPQNRERIFIVAFDPKQINNKPLQLLA